MNQQFQRIERLPPYVFNIIGELKQQARARGEDIIDFGMGNPDQPTPQHIVDKLKETVERGDTHRYSQSKGIPRLRKAMCDWYASRYDVDLDPETEAIVTLGSKEGLAHLALATTGVGDAILVPNPSYPIHPYGFVISGADLRHVPMTEDGDFFEELDKAIRNTYPRPKMLVLNFPSNPTGDCVELDFFEKVVAVAREHKIWVVHDLAYADLVFDGYKGAQHPSGARCARCGSGVFHAVQELQHARLASRILLWKQRIGRRAYAHKILSRLRHLHACAGGCNLGARVRSILCRGSSANVPRSA